MAHAILMPRPGQMTEECTIVAWRKAEGDEVRRGDVLFEIETDKSVMDVESFHDGILLRILVSAGQTAAVNAVCAYVGAAGEALPDEVGSPEPSTRATPVVSSPAASTSPARAGAPGPAPTGAGGPGGDARRVAISPRARRLAGDHGIDPTTLAGSGPGGRIVERDVRAAIAAVGPAAAAAGVEPTVPAPAPGSGAGTAGPDAAPQPMSRMRRVIAERLTASWTTTPHFTITVQVDVSALEALRAERKAATGAAPSVTDFVLAASAATLVEFPDVNARTDGTSVWPRARVHLGMAVAVPNGLVVPVIRDANRLTVAEIHDRAAALAAAARAGTIPADDLSGSTFTVSNLGMYGVDEFSAIINPGEAAILAVAAAVSTPVAVDGRVEVRSVMKLTLSADHRLVDGALGAQFLKTLQTRLERPASLPLGGSVMSAASPAGHAGAPTREWPPSGDRPDAFDLIVLGAGTGGYTAAFRAAQMGLKVALVDADKAGGACLHRGCIPTKAILESAGLAHRVREQGRRLGVVATGVAIDYAAVAEHRDAVVRRMWTGLQGLVARSGVEWVAGRGRLDGPGRVRVVLHGPDGTPFTGGVRVLTAPDVILATGSRVKSLPGLVPDGVRVLTSDDIVRGSELPASLVVVGAGAVGCEFASAFHDLGVAVTLLEYLPAILPLEDRDVSRELERTFARRGIRVVTGARINPASIVVGPDSVGLVVARDGGFEPAEVTAEAMLVATGRAANVDDVGLETTGARVTGGVVEVDAWMRTSQPGLWAIGDVVGGLQLAHTAAHEALVAVAAITGDPAARPMDQHAQPRATYTRPEVASVGLTEQACEASGIAVRVGRVPFTAIARAVMTTEAEGFAKVIAHRDTGALLGVHVVGPHATEIIGEASLAAALGLPAAALGAMTHPHPTLSEVLGEAALTIEGRAINA